jgi:hypothetical protein
MKAPKETDATIAAELDIVKTLHGFLESEFKVSRKSAFGRARSAYLARFGSRLEELKMQWLRRGLRSE